jgi:hypothetical protein
MLLLRPFEISFSPAPKFHSFFLYKCATDKAKDSIVREAASYGTDLAGAVEIWVEVNGFDLAELEWVTL